MRLDQPPLEPGLVGNGRVLALVHSGGAICWSCLPHADSPSVFGALLDDGRGGAFRVLHEEAGELEATTRGWVGPGPILRSEFAHGAERWELIDFAPCTSARPSLEEAPRWFVRLLRPLAGAPRLRLACDARPDFGRRTDRPARHGGALSWPMPGDLAFELRGSLPDDVLAGERTLVLDRPVALVWGCAIPADAPRRAEALLGATLRRWQSFVDGCSPPALHREAVLRSAVTLALLSDPDTGALLAAATTSLPEAIGTPRTWDYRYCWLRDGAFTADALRRLGPLDEALRFSGFVSRVAAQGPLQPLYGRDGRRDLPESELAHLGGWAGTQPVRVGNAAALQQQNDIQGELVLFLRAMADDPRVPLEALGGEEGLAALITRLGEEARVNAPKLDLGIWEYRDRPRNYLFSRAMCWAALHHGAPLLERLGLPERAAGWRTEAAAEQALMLERGWSEERGFFTQALDGEYPDAANLLLPSLGLIDARDPRFLSTLDAYAERLGVSGLLQRYTHADDFGDTTSAFLVCSFWWAEALGRAGRREEGLALLERLVDALGPLGLATEDLDPTTGAALGNFPQAYSHTGLITAALALSGPDEARGPR